MVAVRRAHEPRDRRSTSRPGSRGGRTRNRPTPPRETSQYSLPPKHPCTTPRHSPACRTSPRDLPSSWPRGVSRPCRTRTASPAILKHRSRCSARNRSRCSRRTRRLRQGSARCSRPRFSEGRRRSRSSSPRGRRIPTGLPKEAREKVDLFKVKLFIDFLNKLPTVFPAHILHRPIRRLELTRVLAHQRFPERLGARCVEHPEAFGDRDLVLWSFVRVSPFLVGRRTHQEPTRRDPAEALADGAEWNLRRSASSSWPRVSWAASRRSPRS